MMASSQPVWPPKSRFPWALFVSKQYEWLPLDVNPKKTVKCKHCGNVFAYNITRCRAHLIGEKVGTGRVVSLGGRRPRVSDNTTCLMVPNEVRNYLLRLLKNTNDIVEDEKSERFSNADSELGERRETSSMERVQIDNISRTGTTITPTTPVTPISTNGSDGFSTPIVSSFSQPFRRRNMYAGTSNESREDIRVLFNSIDHDKIHELFAKLFISNGWSFNSANNPLLRQVIKEIQKCPTYTYPSEKRMRNRDLVKIKAQCQVETEAAMKIGLITKGTITSDGWTNVLGRPLMNILVICLKGEFYRKSIDCGSETKDAIFIATKLIEEIDIIGPKNIIQCVTDNAASCKNAGAIISERYPHIIWGGCVAHGINLVLKDWGKLEIFHRIFQKCRRMVRFIKNHHKPHTLFNDKFKRDLGLLKPAKTRFATNFIMIDRAWEIRSELRSMIVSEEWETYLAGELTIKTREGARFVREVLLDDTYWQEVEDVRNLMEDVFVLLRMVDSRGPTMASVYWHSWCLQDKITNFHLKSITSIFSKEICDELVALYHERWQNWRNILHSVAMALNPKLLFDEENAHYCYNAGVRREFHSYLSIWATGILQKENTEDINAFKDSCLEEVACIRNRIADFGSVDCARQALSLNPLTWWSTYGSFAPNLQKIAECVLVQTTTSSACERHWSSMGFIHNKTRNRLTHCTAEDLVYVYHNLRINSQDIKFRSRSMIIFHKYYRNEAVQRRIRHRKGANFGIHGHIGDWMGADGKPISLSERHHSSNEQDYGDKDDDVKDDDFLEEEPPIPSFLGDDINNIIYPKKTNNMTNTRRCQFPHGDTNENEIFEDETSDENIESTFDIPSNMDMQDEDISNVTIQTSLPNLSVGIGYPTPNMTCTIDSQLTSSHISRNILSRSISPTSMSNPISNTIPTTSTSLDIVPEDDDFILPYDRRHSTMTSMHPPISISLPVSSTTTISTISSRHHSHSFEGVTLILDDDENDDLPLILRNQLSRLQRRKLNIEDASTLIATSSRHNMRRGKRICDSSSDGSSENSDKDDV